MKWISVKDRLPEKNQKVLAYGILMTGYTESWDTIDADTDEELLIQAVTFEQSNCTTTRWILAEYCCSMGLYNVTHWMPLPERPQ